MKSLRSNKLCGKGKKADKVVFALVRGTLN